jgi:hypothetical protein
MAMTDGNLQSVQHQVNNSNDWIKELHQMQGQKKVYQNIDHCAVAACISDPFEAILSSRPIQKQD